MTIIFGVDYDNIASSGFPPAIVARVIAAMCKTADRPRDPAVVADNAALGADMAAHQGEHRAHAALKSIHALPRALVDLAGLAKGSVAAPLSGGLPDASAPDLAHIRLRAPPWVKPGSVWEMPGASTSGWSAGEARPMVVVQVGADGTALVRSDFAIALLSIWASAHAEPGDPGGGYRHADSISTPRTDNIDAQRDARPGARVPGIQDTRAAARSPSSADRRPGGDPYGQDHSR